LKHSTNLALYVYTLPEITIGFPLRLPVHREDLTEDEFAEVVSEINRQFVSVQSHEVSFVLVSYVSTALVETSKKPVILAGGLNHENVLRAIKEVKPWRVDVHTGVEERNGIKNFTKV
jgi:hypothetical protein